MSGVKIPTPEELEDKVKENKEKAKEKAWEEVRLKLNIAKDKRVLIENFMIRHIPDDEFKEVMNEKGFSVEYKGEEAPFGYIITW